MSVHLKTERLVIAKNVHKLRKVSVRPNTERPLSVRFLLIDNYLKEFKRKQLNNKKSSIREWVQFFLYFTQIIKEIICLNIVDKRTRLILVDISLFVAGIKQYYHFSIISAWCKSFRVSINHSND